MVGLVLAAGAGTKIWPYNETRQKCAIPVGNKPAIRWLAEDLLNLGLQGLVVGLEANGSSVRHALHGLPEDRVRFVNVGGCNGTAEAALSLIEEAGGDEWLVAYGDIVCPRENLEALLKVHRESRPAAAALVTPLGNEASNDWIIAHISNGQLTEISGHSREGSTRLCGVFTLSPRAAPHLRNNPGLVRHVPVGGMPPLEADIAESLQMMVDDGLEVATVSCREFFVDLDKPWHILEANHHLADHIACRCEKNLIPPSCRISERAEINGRLVLGEDVVIGDRVIIRGTLWAGDGAEITNGAILGGNLFVGHNAKVRDYCAVDGGSALGDRCIVGHGAEFSGVAFDNVYLYHYCEIRGVLGSSVDVGAATVCGTLRFDDRDSPQRIKGRLEFAPVGADATYIGDHSRTGVNAIIMPGRKIGCYSCVGPGVILYDDLPSRKAVFAKQELSFRDWGPERYGW